MKRCHARPTSSLGPDGAQIRQPPSYFPYTHVHDSIPRTDRQTNETWTSFFSSTSIGQPSFFFSLSLSFCSSFRKSHFRRKKKVKLAHPPSVKSRGPERRDLFVACSFLFLGQACRSAVTLAGRPASQPRETKKEKAEAKKEEKKRPSVAFCLSTGPSEDHPQCGMNQTVK